MNSTYSELDLEKPDQSGKAPEKRVRDVEAARGMFDTLMDSYTEGQGIINTLVKRSLDGNPPFDQAEMDRLGLSDNSNLNFRLLEADITQATMPYYSMFREVPTYIECVINYGTSNEKAEYSRIFSEEHKVLMDEWNGFDIAMQSSIKGRVVFGYGPLYFLDEEDFRFEYAPEGTILYPSLTKLDIDKMNIVFIYNDEDISKLYSITRNDSASKAGWNVDQVKKAMSESDSNPYLNSQDVWEEYQRKIRHNDLGVSVIANPIRIVHMFVKEYDGNITHAIFTSNVKTDDYLFYRKGRYSNWRQIIHPMFSEIGDGYWAGVKGLGVKSYNFRDTQNRLKNRFVDAAMKGSQILAQASTPEAEEEFQMTSMGPVSTISHGVNFLPNPLSAAVEKSIVVDRMLEVDLGRNISGFRQNLVNADSGSAISATEASINANRQDSLSLQQVVQALTQMDDLYNEQVSRLVKPISGKGEWQDMAKRFQNRCIARGIPKEALSKVEKVRAYRPIGHGSRLERNQILSALMNMSGMMPMEVRVRILRDFIASIAGQSYLENIWPKEDVGTGPTNAESEAQLENGLFNQGMQAIITDNQDHVAHSQVHLAFIMSRVNPIKAALLEDQENGKQVLLQQGPAVISMAKLMAPHIQQHMQLMWKETKKSQETQSIFNAFEQTYAYITQLAQQLFALMKSMKKQAGDQSGQQQLTKQDIELLKAQGDEARKNMKLEQDIKRDNAKALAQNQRDVLEFKRKQFIDDQVAAAKIKSLNK